MRLLILTFFFLASACQTTSDETNAPLAERPMPPREIMAARRAAMAIPVKNDTVLPSEFSLTLPDPGERRLLVPAGMLMVSEIVRPRAEVRSGPGVQFELADKVLSQGTDVLVFEQVGVWSKVVVMATSQTGWIHRQALADPRPSDVPMVVDARRLPTVLAMRDLKEVKRFPEQERLSATIPKGAMFRTLKYADAGTLVLLPETSSVMWVSGKDVQ